MIRQIIRIDEEKCNGCGLCAQACHESAIAMVDGKAKLIRDDYCDGMGDCLPNCPTGAISFEEREAAAYDREAVEANMKKKKAEEMQKTMQAKGTAVHPAGGCPGSAARQMRRTAGEQDTVGSAAGTSAQTVLSQLGNWPVQIKLAPVQAPYFDGAKLLIAADCTAYSYANFHQEFIRGKVTLVGCPKLDGVDYSEKLTQIIRNNDIQSVQIVRMEVPCCGGLEMAAKKALQESGKFIPWQVVTISIDGNILD
ncbi:MAG TPA: 4Fe-4S binding protein [Candidatus Eisenbergiella merdipullorum]|uniref:4Fe-4S binding protein n=1 Tax=Candidatus Eisenbergiella merdipullorum TaxID=2838553 RepID=A0A9D2I924_9FIRM|nr:4Fe-4S binding protein [Candidatus Eisenbergiella merdipullorum]